jgi:hypothetical protein
MPSAAQRVQEDRQISRVVRGADAAIDNQDEPLEPTVLGDRQTRLSRPNWSRMRRTWEPEDKFGIDEIMREADSIVRNAFPVAFALMEEIYSAARFKRCDEVTGLAIPGPDGRTAWEVGPDGTPREDWTRIGDGDRDQWLYVITTHLFEWEQQRSKLWGQAMYAKGRWEEVFSNAFQSGQAGSTVDDKTQYGQSRSMESRYFGIFQALVSRQADALVRSMERIQGLLERNAR